jgi:putative SOS response-associated peptidase YedK
LPEPPIFESYNIAPSQNILALRFSPESHQVEWAKLHWGLISFWSNTEKLTKKNRKIYT